MKLIGRFKPRTVLPRFNEPRFGEWEPWTQTEGSEGLTTEDLEELLTNWQFHRRFDDPRIWQHIDALGIEQHRIVDDNFDVDSYNRALAE